MSPKEIVKAFYDSDLTQSANPVDTYFHKDCKLHWHSSKEFSVLDFNAIKKVFGGVSESYTSLTFQISHLLEEENKVTIRYTSFITTIENPDEEIPSAHFMTIWEIKDGKIYKGYQMSQLANDSDTSLASFS